MSGPADCPTSIFLPWELVACGLEKLNFELEATVKTGVDASS